MMRFKIGPMANDACEVSDYGIAFSQNQKNYCACKRAGLILRVVQSSNECMPTASGERNR